MPKNISASCPSFPSWSFSRLGSAFFSAVFCSVISFSLVSRYDTRFVGGAAWKCFVLFLIMKLTMPLSISLFRMS